MTLVLPINSSVIFIRDVSPNLSYRKKLPQRGTGKSRMSNSLCDSARGRSGFDGKLASNLRKFVAVLGAAYSRMPVTIYGKSDFSGAGFARI